MKSLGEKMFDAFTLAGQPFGPFDWADASPVLQAAWDKAAVAFVARLSDAPQWQPIETAPQDGTLILTCQRPDASPLWFKSWEQWKAPQTVAWRAFHPNAPGKTCWRDAKGSPVSPDFWMPLDRFAVAEAA